MKNVMNGSYINYKTDELIDFGFYTDLNISNKLEFVNSIVSIVVDGENYNSIIRDLMFNFFLVRFFSDVNTDEFIVEDSIIIDKIEEFLEDTNIVDIIKVNMEFGLLEELDNSVDLGIEYRTGIHINSLNKELANLVNMLESKLNDVNVEDMMKIMSKFNDMSGEFTPENVVNAYMNSDLHKKNEKEIEESKKNMADATKIVDLAAKTGVQL